MAWVGKIQAGGFHSYKIFSKPRARVAHASHNLSCRQTVAQHGDVLYCQGWGDVLRFDPLRNHYMERSMRATGTSWLSRAVPSAVSLVRLRCSRPKTSVCSNRLVRRLRSRLEISCRLSSTSNRQVSTEYYTAYVVADDKRQPVAEGFVGQSAAEALCREVGRSTRLGLS